MAPKGRTKAQILQEREIIAELYLKGWTERQIANYLELSHAMIHQELLKIRDGWSKRAIECYDLRVNKELRRLDMVERECWAAWERSQGTLQSELTERIATGRDGSGTPVGRVRTMTKTEAKVGDVQFMNAILKVISERIRLLQLAPTPPKQLPAIEALKILVEQGIALPQQAEVLHEGVVAIEEKLKHLSGMITDAVIANESTQS